MTRTLPCRVFVFEGVVRGSSGHETVCTKYVPYRGPFSPFFYCLFLVRTIVTVYVADMHLENIGVLRQCQRALPQCPLQ